MDIFTRFLEFLKVKHTTSFSTRLYGEHPYKYALFGISKMLSIYKIPNMGFKLNDKDNITSLEVPFVAQISRDIVLVTGLDRDRVEYITSHDRHVEVALNKFKENWSGVVLLAERNEESCEPDYRGHAFRDYFKVFEKYVIAVLLFLSVFLAYYGSGRLFAKTDLLMLIVNALGIYVSYLLLLKQMRIHSRSADKICSLLKKGDCNDVLESPAAKFMGIIGWSEVGMSYFLSNVFMIIFFPSLISYVVLINMLTLPFSFWSVWYQKFKAKQWCPLCLVVLLLMWLFFGVCRMIGVSILPIFTFSDILFVISVYLMPVFVINLLLPKFVEARKVMNLTQEFYGLKMRDEIFLSSLKTQSYHEVDRTVSRILFGNPDAQLLITVFSNPHCNPCAKMHERIEELLERIGDKICVQYIFTSFSDDLESSSEFLIALYLNQVEDMAFVRKVYAEWFSGGKMRRKEFFEKYKQDFDKSIVEAEYDKHIAWRSETSLGGTPTILVNGYELPANYKLEDLEYFTDLQIVFK